MRRSLEVALSQLNSEQREAATERGHCLVMACPGSGKTRTLAVKAALLLDSEPLARTCIVTFTKDGASELKRRTIDILDGDAASGNRLIAGTFHGLCYRMLSKVRKINLKNIVSDAEQFHYAERALAEVKIFDVDKHAALSLIEHARSLPHLADARAKLLADVYLDIMRRNGKLDFSDLVIDTIAGLESGAIPPIPAAYMLIDEFQDTDWLQYRWARQHSANGTKITVVGDDDQAIFGWRFAMGYEGMMTFADDHDAHRVVLGHNYRCRSEILDAAGRVIVYNINRVPKTLVAAKGPGGSVGCDEYATIADEALAILDAFRDFASEDYSAAVIGRTNRSLKTIEAVLKPAGIPCTITRSASLFRAIETHVYLDLAEVVATGHSKGIDNALAWSGFQPNDLRSLHQKFGNQLILGSKTDYEGMELDADSVDRWKEFVVKMIGLQAQNESGESWINVILESIRSWMEDHNPASIVSASAENVELIHAVFSNLRGDLKARLEAVRRMSKDDDKDDKTRKVVLTTMHKSKGLEWDRVMIIRAEDGVCPSADSDVDEERRLFYVAMTRARERLNVSYTRASQTSSQFIDEAKLIPVVHARRLS